jgi:hypothetical protein
MKVHLQLPTGPLELEGTVAETLEFVREISRPEPFTFGGEALNVVGEAVSSLRDVIATTVEKKAPAAPKKSPDSHHVAGERTTLEPRTIPCPHCDRKFSREQALSRHLRETHGGKPMEAEQALREARPLGVPPHHGRQAAVGKLTLQRLVEAARAWFEGHPGGVKGYCATNHLNVDLVSSVVTQMAEMMGGHRHKGLTQAAPELREQWEAMTPERRLELAQQALSFRKRPGSGTAPSAVTSTASPS